MAAIEVDGLTKDYGSVRANDGVSFTVERGEVFGFLGPNGAGKTTTIRTLMGFQSPTHGSASLLGHDVTDEAELLAAKRRVGYLPARPAFDETVTGREALDLHAAIKGDERREELLDRFTPPLDREIRAYSTGNVQKLGLVQAFMHDPDLVILDEPTSGLDPLLQRSFNDFVDAERERGLSVLLSSHVLSEVRRICDRVGILREGRLVTTERVAELLGRTGKLVRATVADDVDTGAFDLDGVHDCACHTTAGSDNRSEGEADDAPNDGAGRTDADGEAGARARTGPVTECQFTYTGDVNALVDRLDEHRLLDLDVEEAPLDEVFLRFYGSEGADDSD
jgi:ABC-2 type transport system ATP-binding protein